MPHEPGHKAFDFGAALKRGSVGVTPEETPKLIPETSLMAPAPVSGEPPLQRENVFGEGLAAGDLGRLVTKPEKDWYGAAGAWYGRHMIAAKQAAGPKIIGLADFPDKQFTWDEKSKSWHSRLTAAAETDWEAPFSPDPDLAGVGPLREGMLERPPRTWEDLSEEERQEALTTFLKDLLDEDEFETYTAIAEGREPPEGFSFEQVFDIEDKLEVELVDRDSFEPIGKNEFRKAEILHEARDAQLGTTLPRYYLFSPEGKNDKGVYYPSGASSRDLTTGTPRRAPMGALLNHFWRFGTLQNLVGEFDTAPAEEELPSRDEQDRSHWSRHPWTWYAGVEGKRIAWGTPARDVEMFLERATEEQVERFYERFADSYTYWEAFHQLLEQGMDPASVLDKEEKRVASPELRRETEETKGKVINRYWILGAQIQNWARYLDVKDLETGASEDEYGRAREAWEDESVKDFQEWLWEEKDLGVEDAAIALSEYYTDEITQFKPIKELGEDFRLIHALPPLLEEYLRIRTGHSVKSLMAGRAADTELDRKIWDTDTTDWQGALLYSAPLKVQRGEELYRAKLRVHEDIIPLGWKTRETTPMLAKLEAGTGKRGYYLRGREPSTEALQHLQAQWEGQTQKELLDPFGLRAGTWQALSFDSTGYVWSGEMAEDFDQFFTDVDDSLTDTERELYEQGLKYIDGITDRKYREHIKEMFNEDPQYRAELLLSLAITNQQTEVVNKIATAKALKYSNITEDELRTAMDPWGGIKLAELTLRLKAKYVAQIMEEFPKHENLETLSSAQQEVVLTRADKYARADIAKFGSMALQGGALLIDNATFNTTLEIAELPAWKLWPSAAMAPQPTTIYSSKAINTRSIDAYKEGDGLAFGPAIGFYTAEQFQHRSSLDTFFRMFPTTWAAGMLDHYRAEIKMLDAPGRGEQFMQKVLYGTTEKGLTKQELEEQQGSNWAARDWNWWMPFVGEDLWTEGANVFADAVNTALGTAPDVDFATKVRLVNRIRNGHFLAEEGGAMFEDWARSMEMSKEGTEWMKRSGMVLFFAPEFYVPDPITGPIFASRLGMRAVQATKAWKISAPRHMEWGLKQLRKAAKTGDTDKIIEAQRLALARLKKYNAPAHNLVIMEAAAEATLAGPYLQSLDQLVKKAAKARKAAKKAAKDAGIWDYSPILLGRADHATPVARKVWLQNRARELYNLGHDRKSAMDLAKGELKGILKTQADEALSATKPGDVYLVTKDGIDTYYVRLVEDGKEVFRPWVQVDPFGQISKAGVGIGETAPFTLAPKTHVGKSEAILTFRGLGDAVDPAQLIGATKANELLFSEAAWLRGQPRDVFGAAGKFVDAERLVEWVVDGARYAPRSAPNMVASAYGIPIEKLLGPVERGRKTVGGVERFEAGTRGLSGEVASGRQAWHEAGADLLQIQYESALARAKSLRSIADDFAAGEGALYLEWKANRDILKRTWREQKAATRELNAIEPRLEKAYAEFAIAREALKKAEHERKLAERALKRAKTEPTKIKNTERLVTAEKEIELTKIEYEKAKLAAQSILREQAAASERFIDAATKNKAATELVHGTEEAMSKGAKGIEGDPVLQKLSKDLKEAEKAGKSAEELSEIRQAWNKRSFELASTEHRASFFKEIPKMELALRGAARNAEKTANKIGTRYKREAAAANRVGEAFEAKTIDRALSKKWKAIEAEHRAQSLRRVLERLVKDIRVGEKALKSAPKLSNEFKSILAGAVKHEPESVGAFRAMRMRISGLNPTVGNYVIDAAELKKLLHKAWGKGAVERILEEIGTMGATRGGEAGDLLRRILLATEEGIPTVPITAPKKLPPAPKKPPEATETKVPVQEAKVTPPIQKRTTTKRTPEEEQAFQQVSSELNDVKKALEISKKLDEREAGIKWADDDEFWADPTNAPLLDELKGVKDNLYKNGRMYSYGDDDVWKKLLRDEDFGAEAINALQKELNKFKPVAEEVSGPFGNALPVAANHYEETENIIMREIRATESRLATARKALEDFDATYPPYSPSLKEIMEIKELFARAAALDYRTNRPDILRKWVEKEGILAENVGDELRELAVIQAMREKYIGTTWWARQLEIAKMSPEEKLMHAVSERKASWKNIREDWLAADKQILRRNWEERVGARQRVLEAVARRDWIFPKGEEAIPLRGVSQIEDLMANPAKLDDLKPRLPPKAKDPFEFPTMEGERFQARKRAHRARLARLGPRRLEKLEGRYRPPPAKTPVVKPERYVELTPEEVYTLETITGQLHRAWRVSHEKAHEIAVVDALRIARGDVESQLFKGETTLEARITNGAKRIAAKMDPVRIHLGEVDKEIGGVLRAVRNLSDQARSDIFRLGRTAEEQALRDLARDLEITTEMNLMGKTSEEIVAILGRAIERKGMSPAKQKQYVANKIWDALEKFLSKTDPLAIEIRAPILPLGKIPLVKEVVRPELLKTTWFNTVGDGQSVWDEMRQWILSDPRMRPGGMPAYIEEFESALKGMDASIDDAAEGAQIKVKRGKKKELRPVKTWEFKSTGNGIIDDTVDGLRLTLPEGTTAAELKLAARAKFRETGFDPKTWAMEAEAPSMQKNVLIGLARAFIPHGDELLGSGTLVDNYLAQKAYELLRGEYGLTAGRFKESMIKVLSEKHNVPGWGTFDGWSPVVMENARAYAYLAELTSHGAIFNRANKLTVKAMGGFLDPIEVKAANRIFETTGGGWRSMEAGDIEKGLAAVLNPLGKPFTQRMVKPVKDSLRFLNMIKTGEDMSGRSYHMSKVLADAIDGQLSSVIKELEAYNHGVREPIIKAWAGALRLWRTSVVTGLIVPRPLYFMNNLAGDISQIWGEMGIAQSARTNFQLITGIPWFSKRLYGYRKWVVDTLGTENVLPDVGGAFFNPIIARVFAGEKFTLRTKGGKILNSQDLLRGAIERGVMDSYANVDLLNQLTKLGNKRGWNELTALKGWQDDISEMATYVQQRQRFSLYCDMIRQGKTEAYAAKKVMDAIYDWKNGIAQWEANWLNNIIPFYRFWRLAMSQQMRLLLEPLTKPTFGKNGQLLKALTGRTVSARVRQQFIMLNQLPQFLDPTIMEDLKDIEGQKEELMKTGMPPDWITHARGMLGWGRVPQSTTDLHMATRGTKRPVTHTFGMTGPFTGIETSTLLADYFQGMAGALIDNLPSKYLGAGDVESGDRWKQMLNPNWKANFYRQGLEMLHPHTKELLKSTIMRYGYETVSGYTPNRLQVKPHEEAIIIHAPNLIWGLDKGDLKRDQFGRMTAPAFSLWLWRMLPVAHEFSSLFGKIGPDNPEAVQFWNTKEAKDFSIGFQSFLGRHTGVTIPYTEIRGQRYPVSAPYPQVTMGEPISPSKDIDDPGIPSQIARRQFVQQQFVKRLMEDTEPYAPKSLKDVFAENPKLWSEIGQQWTKTLKLGEEGTFEEQRDAAIEASEAREAARQRSEK